MHDPSVKPYNALKRIICYISGTQYHGLQLYNTITSYLDDNWPGYPNKSMVYIGLMSVCRRKLDFLVLRSQQIVSHSIAAEKHRGVTNIVAAVWWIQKLFEFHLPISKVTLTLCDNVSYVNLASNLVGHQKTSHVELDLHFFREIVAVRHVTVFAYWWLISTHKFSLKSFHHWYSISFETV